MLSILAVSFAPIFFLFFYIYIKDKYEREPLINLIISFILGGLMAFPVMTVGTYLRGITGWSSQGNPIMLFLYVFFIVACVEEGFKYLCLRLYSYRLPVFDEPYDGIMYAVAVSLGFAAVENILYVAHYGLNTGLLRMFTAVPSHVVFAICMGYFVGKGKFIAPKPAFWQHAIGLLLAISAHALYDYFLFLHIGILGLVSIFLLYISIFFSRKALHLHAEISPHKDIEA